MLVAAQVSSPAALGAVYPHIHTHTHPTPSFSRRACPPKCSCHRLSVWRKGANACPVLQQAREDLECRLLSSPAFRTETIPIRASRPPTLAGVAPQLLEAVAAAVAAGQQRAPPERGIRLQC